MSHPFGLLQQYREKPIPCLDEVRQAKKGYRQHLIDTTRRLYKDGWVDLRECFVRGMNYYYRFGNPPYYQTIDGSIKQLYVRECVLQMLKEVDLELHEVGLELFVHDAWRPAALQYYMRNVWFAGELRKRHPSWSEEQIEAEVGNYWALAVPSEAEIDPLSPPPHSTGGAVDLTIRWVDGEPLWMGTLFDDVTRRAHTDSLEPDGNELSFSDEEARMNRRLLYWLMRKAGFANNPTEWWHYSYGDQMWAKLNSAEQGARIPAVYSCINPLA